jgi:hypothetical protein
MTVIEPAAEPRKISVVWHLAWSSILLGALTAAALSSIFITFGMAVGLGVSSASPTWRDASVALWLLSGIFLTLAALVSFGCGGYLAARTRPTYNGSGPEDIERQDGWHGVGSWALGVVLSLVLAGVLAASASNHPSALSRPPSSSEPSILSYEIDRLFHAQRRLPNEELAPIRAEVGRILLTSSSHSGVSGDDRVYLTQLVGTVTGMTGADADRRVDTAIADAKRAISHARASAIILAFSIAASLLFGVIAAWAAAEAGGRHRDGMPLPGWMMHRSRFNYRKEAWQRPMAVP